MNSIAHDTAHHPLAGVINLWPEDAAEDTLEMGPWQRAALFAAIGLALMILVLAIVLQTAYQGLIFLWIWLGLPMLFIAKSAARIGRTGVDGIRAWSDPTPPQSGEASRHEVRLTFDELALIYKSLEAVKTLAALPPQDELLQETIQVVDQSLNTFVR